MPTANPTKRAFRMGAPTFEKGIKLNSGPTPILQSSQSTTLSLAILIFLLVFG